MTEENTVTEDQINENNEVQGDANENVGNVVADGDDEAQAAAPGGEGEQAGEDGQQSFSRDYVTKLRKESAGYREKAKRSDDLARQLHTALVKLDGRLADPEDVPFHEEHLEDPGALTEAITSLVARKPGLRAQQLSGDVGQGKRGSAEKQGVDLISIIRDMQ